MQSEKDSSSQVEAEKRIHEILTSKFGREVIRVSLDPRSNNSRVYILSLSPSISKPKDQGHSPGTEALPSDAEKVVIRFTNPDSKLNDNVSVESEVASMVLARNALQSLGIVPRVYGWSSASSGVGWILMEFMDGAPMEASKFTKFSLDDRQGILDQIAHIFKLIQQYDLPASVTGYGGLGFALDGSVVTGPTPIHGAATSCENYRQLYEQYFHTQIRFMDQCDIVKGWKDTNLRKRIDEFLNNGFGPLIQRASAEKPRQTLIHADFDLHNLLFDPESNRVTALLDFSFSHIASAADEYFYSFDSIQSLLSPEDDDVDKNHLRESLLHGFQESTGKRESTGMVNWATAALTYKAFSNAHVYRPIDLMPEIEPLSELYWFIQNISPGIFFLPRFRARVSPEKAKFMRTIIQGTLEKQLSAWGF